MYCSMQCENQAWKNYHKHQCSTMASLLDETCLLNQLITKTGFNTLLQMSNIVKENIQQGNVPQKYKNVYNLKEHLGERSEDLQFLQALNAVSVFSSLSRFGDLIPVDSLELCTHQKSNSEANYCIECFIDVLEIILRHVEQISCNAIEISKYKYQSSTRTWKKVRTGAGLYNVMSLFNHSCDENAYTLFYQDTIVIRTTQPIKAGKEVCISYYNFYANSEKIERQKMMRERYCFECTCDACKQNYPQLEVQRNLDVDALLDQSKFKCGSCRTTISDSSKCDCGAVTDVKAFNTSIKNTMELCNKLDSLDEILKAINEVMNKLTETVEKPNLLFIHCQALLLDYFKVEASLYIQEKQRNYQMKSLQ